MPGIINLTSNLSYPFNGPPPSPSNRTDEGDVGDPAVNQIGIPLSNVHNTTPSEYQNIATPYPVATREPNSPLIQRTRQAPGAGVGTEYRNIPYSLTDKQPYIRTYVPGIDEPSPSSGLFGKDVIGRNGQIRAGIEDAKRIGKWYLDGTGGLISAIKDNALMLTNPKPIGPKFGLAGQRPKRLYNPLSTVAQVAIGANSGLHLNRQGLLPFFPVENSYANIVKNEYNGNGDTPNRLTYLRQSKLLGNPIPSVSADELSVNGTEETILIEYMGGPGSILGVGKTKIKRYDYTEEWAKNNEKRLSKFQLLALNYKQLDDHGNEFSTKIKGTGLGAIPNFAQTIKEKSTSPDPVKKRILGRVSNYVHFNRSKTYGAGDPGDSTDLDRWDYYEGLPKNNVKGLDKVNFNKLYTSADVKVGDGYNDIIKFYFATIDNDNPSNKVYTHFRAYLTNFGDNYSSEWNSFRYMGRGENFYRYAGFDRSISLGFQVHAGSRAELLPIYDKLNYLASVMAPDYSNGGFMRGNIVEMTVGDYLNNVPGIIEKLDFSFPMDSPWEIAKLDEFNLNADTYGGEEDPNSAELPTLIEVSMNFKPIHKFLPRTVKPQTIGDRVNSTDTLPESSFISLGSDNKGYKHSSTTTSPVDSIPAESTPTQPAESIDPIEEALKEFDIPFL